MPAMQLTQCSAAIVSDGDAPNVTVVQLSGPGVVIFGRAAVEQLRDACNLALSAGYKSDYEVKEQQP